MNLAYAITVSPGLESLTRDEVKRLGVKDILTDNRLVRFNEDEKFLALLNIKLRTANRVYLET